MNPETKRLKEIIGELENAARKAVNDLETYKRMIEDYGLDKELKEQILLQFETLKLPLKRVLK